MKLVLAKQRADMLYQRLKKLEKEQKIKPSKFGKKVFKVLEDFLRCNLSAPCIVDRYNKFLELLQNKDITDEIL